MWYYSPTKTSLYQVRANTYDAVHRFDAWDMAVPGLYIFWYKVADGKHFSQSLKSHSLWVTLYMQYSILFHKFENYYPRLEQ